ncbi:MAG: Uncharacterised protein [Pseudidiomarina mangrovi]|nr:MAG: Uncharacterised protein [Pseudidiomarina mangrovi]
MASSVPVARYWTYSRWVARCPIASTFLTPKLTQFVCSTLIPNYRRALSKRLIYSQRMSSPPMMPVSSIFGPITVNFLAPLTSAIRFTIRSHSVSYRAALSIIYHYFLPTPQAYLIIYRMTPCWLPVAIYRPHSMASGTIFCSVMSSAATISNGPCYRHSSYFSALTSYTVNSNGGRVFAPYYPPTNHNQVRTNLPPRAWHRSLLTIKPKNRCKAYVNNLSNASPTAIGYYLQWNQPVGARV